jgi:hypothetical protein
MHELTNYTKYPYLINTQLLWSLLNSLYRRATQWGHQSVFWNEIYVLLSLKSPHGIKWFSKRIFTHTHTYIYIYIFNSLWLLRNETQLGNLYSTTVQFSNSLYFTPVLMRFVQLCSLMYYSKCGNHMDMAHFTIHAKTVYSWQTNASLGSILW